MGKLIYSISKRDLWKYPEMLSFIHQMHIYLLKGIIDLSASKGILQKCKYQNLEHLSHNIHSVIMQEISSGFQTKTEKHLEKIYLNLQNWMASTAIQARPEFRRYESRSSLQYCFKDMGKHSTVLISEIQNIIFTLPPIKDLKPETLVNFETQLFYLLFLAKDLLKLMTKEYFSIYQIYELCKEKSLEKFTIIFQKAVDLLSEAISIGTNERLEKLLKILLLLLTNFLTEFFQMQQLRKIMKQSANGVELDLKLIGFSSNENLYASMMTYAIETILYKTHYYEYENAIRFFSECVKPAFKIFLEALQQFSGKDSSFKKYFERGGEHGSRRDRRQMRIPQSMIEPLTSMGFETQQVEEALREFDLDVSTALNSLLKRREEREKGIFNIHSEYSPVTKEIAMRKIEMKNLQVEIDQWISSIFFKLYEGLYSIGTYKCKYLMFFLTTIQSSKLGFKVNQAFEFFLNELQTLVFFIELTYEFTPIKNDEFPIKELAELPVNNKLKKKIHKYVSLCRITEEAYLILQKMETLISMMTTFVRLSPNSDLIKLMCDNKISECLILILGKLMTEEMILPGRRLFSKILILLSMIFKETYQQMQSELIDKKMESLLGKEFEVESIRHSLPAEAEIRKLLDFLCQLLDNEKLFSEVLQKIKKKNNEILSTETITVKNVGIEIIEFTIMLMKQKKQLFSLGLGTVSIQTKGAQN